LSNLTLNFLRNSICNRFEVTHKIRIFNFYGFELLEDLDIITLKKSIEEHKIIFFTLSQDFFENKNIIRAFKFKKKIGEGGYGKVYLSEQKFTHNNYATKIFKRTVSNSNEYLHLSKEIEALSRLDNSYIIKLYTHCILDNRITFILEYAGGGTLKGNKKLISKNI
jgi:hypothetical protein